MSMDLKGMMFSIIYFLCHLGPLAQKRHLSMKPVLFENLSSMSRSSSSENGRSLWISSGSDMNLRLMVCQLGALGKPKSG